MSVVRRARQGGGRTLPTSGRAVTIGLLLTAAGCGAGLENAKSVESAAPIKAESTTAPVDAKLALHGASSYNFYFFDPSGIQQSRPLGMNNRGFIVGFYTDGAGMDHGFSRDPSGNLTSIDVPGASASYVNGVNSLGTLVGSFTDSNGHGHGFKLIPGGAVTVVDPPGSVDVYIGGINDWGQAIGAQGVDSDLAFLVSGGRFISIPPPSQANPLWTNPASINNLLTITGNYLDVQGAVHGFVLHGRQYTTVDSPYGATSLNQVNNMGIAAASYFPFDGSRQQSSIVDTRTLEMRPFSCPPEFAGTALRGINDYEQLSGFCLLVLPDGTVERHAFFASPHRD